MKRASITGCSLAVCVAVLGGMLGLCSLALYYNKQMADDLRLLTGGATVELLDERFGAASEVLSAGEVLDGKGWNTPSRLIDHKVLVFVRRTGMKYFVYLNDRNEIIYVYSSGS